MSQVTKNWIAEYVRIQPDHKVANMVGRALVALLRRQTEEEQATQQTRIHNGVGFTGPDARRGTIAAKTFLKHGKFLHEWQWRRWVVPDRKGYPRIAKYARQLNEIAEAKNGNTA